MASPGRGRIDNEGGYGRFKSRMRPCDDVRSDTLTIPAFASAHDRERWFRAAGRTEDAQVRKTEASGTICCHRGVTTGDTLWNSNLDPKTVPMNQGAVGSIPVNLCEANTARARWLKHARKTCEKAATLASSQRTPLPCICGVHGIAVTQQLLCFLVGDSGIRRWPWQEPVCAMVRSPRCARGGEGHNGVVPDGARQLLQRKGRGSRRVRVSHRLRAWLPRLLR